MLTALFLVWLQMSAQPVTRVTMYESMCRRPMVEYGGRYQVIAGAGECFIFERNIGEVYWSGPHGQAILFPIGSPLDDITRAEFAEAAQRAADETDGKPWKSQNQELGPIPDELRVDVPAVQETRTYKTGTSTIKSAPECEGKPTCNIVIATQDIATEQVTTCKDKSRVLLTSEDGKKHCVKF